jgi:hypothetical protein
MQTMRARLLTVATLAASLPLLHQPAGTGAMQLCAVPARPSLCDSFAVFRRPARPDDRLPRIFRDDPPLKLVDQSSSRRAGGDRPKDRAFYLLGGRRYMCLVDYSRREGGGGYGCSHIEDVLSGRTYLEVGCVAAPHGHRLLFLQPMPDGVRAATVHRVGRPPIRLAVRRNLLVADLRVLRRDELPNKVVWRLRGRLHRLALPVDDTLVTCRASARSLSRAG